MKREDEIRLLLNLIGERQRIVFKDIVHIKQFFARGEQLRVLEEEEIKLKEVAEKLKDELMDIKLFGDVEKDRIFNEAYQFISRGANMHTNEFRVDLEDKMKKFLKPF